MSLTVEQCKDELNDVLHKVLVDTLKIADKYDLDRDETFKTMVEKLYFLSEVGTFREFEL